MPAQASDPPHWYGQTWDIGCTESCHVLHEAIGGTLTQQEDNSNLCLSCHNEAGLAGGLPLNLNQKAEPGVSGTSHAFGELANHPGGLATTPSDPEMVLRLADGNIICSTCHNQHTATNFGVEGDGGTPRIASAAKIVDLSDELDENDNPGALAATGTFTGPEGVFYLIEITEQGSASSARFRYSKDNALSWSPNAAANCDPPTTTSGCLVASATKFELEFGIELKFANSLDGSSGNDFKVGERWEFSASYPFLRVAFGAGGRNFCEKCHGALVMADVTTWTGSAMSHPTSDPIGASLVTYPPIQGDFHDPPLDGNGKPQGDVDADSNDTNNLRLFGPSSDQVTCLTCHGIHFVDSNTQTVDPTRGN
jgi:predicted CXXCH cytochrome family protein